MDLNINNVINISVAASQSGVGAYNTSNLALFTNDPYEASFGSDGYKLYLGPTDVATDFGTDSDTYKMANAIFSQQPNILANGGYLAVITRIVESQTVIFDGVAVSGVYRLNYGFLPTADIAFDATIAEVQVALRLITGLEKVVVTGVAQNYSISFADVEGDISLLTVTDNTMVDGAAGAVTPDIAEVTGGETIGEAITRTSDLIQYFGIISSEMVSETDGLAAAAIVQAMNKIFGVVSRTAADVEVDGYLDLLQQGSFSQTRGLFYGTDTDTKAVVMLASYFGRALSTNFSGSNTTQTMHLKDLTGVLPDPTMDQTLLNKCQLAGADVYANVQGVPKTFTSGENEFFDDVYNLLWCAGALEVAGFNYLATTSTKIPQTEPGMDGLKGAYRKVCEQGISNKFLAAGVWNSPDTFGNQVDFYDNISQRGYYIYSTPIAQQAPSERETRVAPLIQIAMKYAGAIHSSTVIVNINK